MARNTVAFTLDIPGIRPMLRAMSALPKDMQNEIRDASLAIADDEAQRIRAAADTPQQELVAQSVKAKRDRVPAIVAGGSRRLVTGRTVQARAKRSEKTGKLLKRPKPKPRTVVAGDVFFGAEFGGQARDTTQQFERHLGTEGYFFFPTLRADSDRIAGQYLDAVGEVLQQWEAGGQ